MKKWFLSLIVCFSLFSCDDELQPSDAKIAFDALSLLDNVVDNHIIPEFEIFTSDVERLVQAKNDFVTNKTLANLEALQNAHSVVYVSFQAVAKYGFGLAEEIGFYQNLNLHPLNLNGITEFILDQENKNLGSVLTQDRQGLPAVDYLVYGLADTNENILAFYTGANAVDYTTFLSKVVDRISDLSTRVANDWKGTFGNTFKSNPTFSTTLVNGYIQYFEKRLRSSKIDFPAGKFDGSPSPETIESFFNPTVSRDLLIEALESSRSLYIGVNENATSLSRVLIGIGEEGLDAQIKLRFLEAQNLISKLDENLADQVRNDNNKMLEARDALQAIVRLLKIDLTSTLNIAITFQDNDGD